MKKENQKQIIQLKTSNVFLNFIHVLRCQKQITVQQKSGKVPCTLWFTYYFTKKMDTSNQINGNCISSLVFRIVVFDLSC